MKVTHLQLTTALFVPGANKSTSGIQLSRTITPEHYPGIEMSLTSLGVNCHFKSVHFIIPIANVQCAIIDDSGEANAKKAAK